MLVAQKITNGNERVMPAAVSSAFEVAFWFFEEAMNNNEYLQPQKMQRLMFLSQAYFAVAYGGQKLMPGEFVADEVGPIEPNIYAAFSQGRPRVDLGGKLPYKVETFLDGVWRRFGHHSVEHLNRLCMDTPCYMIARRKGREEITIESMQQAFARPSGAAPALDKVVRSKVMRSHTGRAVAVKSWMPNLKKVTKK